MARIGDHRPIGEGRQLLHTQINADHGSRILGYRQLLFHLHGHIPVSRLLAHGSREDLYPLRAEGTPAL